MNYRILLVGGGTGGHVFPLIAVARELQRQSRERGVDLELMCLGEGRFLRESAVQSGLKCKSIAAGKFRRYFSFLNVLDIFKIGVGFFQSLWHIYWFMPDVVFAKGGYSSVTPGLVSKLYFIPLLIHESDSAPGLANRILSKIAKTVFISFETSKKYFKNRETVLAGNPVRDELAGGDRAEAFKFFNLDPNRKTVLIVGGSQGAERINRIVLDSLVMMAKDYQVIHQCGHNQYPLIKREVDRIIKEGGGKYGDDVRDNYRFYPFFDSGQMALAYGAGDVIISRGGSSSIFETSLLGKPAIIIPITDSPADHQLLNALEFSKFGAAVIEEENLTPHIVINQIQSLLEPENYRAASEKIKSFSKPNAASEIAAKLLEI